MTEPNVMTDDKLKDELNADQFEMMFLQTAEGTAPAEPEPVKDEPVEVAKAEPASVVPAEPVKAEPVKAEPVKAEPVKAEPVKAAPAAPEPPAPIDYTEEELKLVASVKKDFPEITQVLAAQERLLTQRFKAELQTEVAKVQQTLAPVYANAEEAAQARFHAAVAEVHADAKPLLPDAEAWIATQPKFLQAAYNQVLDKGTAAEVIEFFTTFKTATGRTAPAGGKTAAELAAETAAAAEKQRKLAAQEGVKGVRVPSKKDTGPLDFESAFSSVH